MKYLPVGTEVWIGPTNECGRHIAGKITAVCIRSSNHITYEVAWWDDRDRFCEWLESIEVFQAGGVEEQE